MLQLCCHFVLGVQADSSCRVQAAPYLSSFLTSSQCLALGLGHSELIVNGEWVRRVMFVLFLPRDIDDYMWPCKGAAGHRSVPSLVATLHSKGRVWPKWRHWACLLGTWVSCMRWTAVGTFHLKCQRMCSSVALFCYRITCLWFCNKRFYVIKRGCYLCWTPYITTVCESTSQRPIFVLPWKPSAVRRQPKDFGRRCVKFQNAHRGVVAVGRGVVMCVHPQPLHSEVLLIPAVTLFVTSWPT